MRGFPENITYAEKIDLNSHFQDVFVVDPFSGEAFSFVSQPRFKCTVIGPRCVLSCLSQGRSIPSLPYPVFTVAMLNCVVTSTGYEKEEKAEIQKKVEMMGGIYSNAFHDGVTHLVTKVRKGNKERQQGKNHINLCVFQIVRSNKYCVAVDKEIPIMTEEWIEQVWERGKHESVKAGDAQFAKYKCPALKGLNITVSQMSRKDKELLKKSIESHGGVYSGILDMDKTAILIIPTSGGDKYEYARKWKIPCLSPEWIFDSIEKGYCLKTDPYRIDHAKASTPTREDVSARLQEVSMCSTIMLAGPDETATVKINETVASANATLLAKDKNDSVEKNLEKLDIQRAKKAGPFLDSCRIFLSGFLENQETHLHRVLQTSGAARMNQITSSVTHIVVGRALKPEHQALVERLKINPHKVTLQWLVESMQMGQPVPEGDFTYVAPANARSRSSLPKVDEAPNEEEDLTKFENDMLAQYQTKKDNTQQQQEQHQDETVKDNTTLTEGEASCTQAERFLLNKKLALVGFEESVEEELSSWVTEAGGDLVFRDFSGTLDYLVVLCEFRRVTDQKWSFGHPGHVF